MPELRQDPVSGRWVVVAPRRILRPGALLFQSEESHEAGKRDECPFCPGNEAMTPHEVYALREPGSFPDTPGWKVRVVPNKYPALGLEGDELDKAGFYRVKPAPGVHEVIIHSPDHFLELHEMGLDALRAVLVVIRERSMEASLIEEVKYVHVACNQGSGSGASLTHPHSQLFGLPLIPALIQTEVAGSMWYYEKNSECVFCRMLEEEKRRGERVVFGNAEFTAVAPFASRFPYEFWIIPERHHPHYVEADDGQLAALASIFGKVTRAYAREFGGAPYNFYFHQAPADGRDYRYYHWHVEMFPRVTELGALELGTEVTVNPVRPEDAARLGAVDIPGC